jgi:hypothetical protein
VTQSSRTGGSVLHCHVSSPCAGKISSLPVVP